MHLSDAANVMTPAYLVLLSKGYSIRLEGDWMIAERGEDSFLADGPVALLGLISVFEARGESWNATDNEIDDFMRLFQQAR